MKRRVVVLIACVIALAASAGAANVHARATGERLVLALQQQPATPQGGGDEFVPVDQLPKPQDQLPAAPLLIAAYVFVWLMLLFYVFTLWRRLGRVEREIGSVSRQIESSRRI